MDISEFLVLPENFKTENIKTGDLYLDSQLKFALARPIISLYSGSLIYHSGIFIWMNKNLEIEYENNGENVLCVLHQSKKKSFDFLTQSFKNDLIIEPISRTLKKSNLIHCRNLTRNIDSNLFISKIKNFLKNTDKYPFPNSLIEAVVEIVLDYKTENMKGFSCSHFTTAFYIETMNYPYGLNNVSNNFKIPQIKYSRYQPKDFLYENNNSPIFDNSPEFLVYDHVSKFEMMFWNPTMISFIIILTAIIIIVLMYFCSFEKKNYFYNSHKNGIFK